VSDYKSSRLYWNNRDGTFTDGTEAAHVGTDDGGMGSAIGDYDNDGDLDWFVTALYCAEMPEAPECSGNRLYRNDGGRRFSDQTDSANVRNGYWGWAADFFDFDNDGDLDIVQTNGVDVPIDTSEDVYAFDPMLLWRNDGASMTEIAQDVGLMDRSIGQGLLTFDYDRDGDLDIFVVNNGTTPRLYRNDGGNHNGWLRVRVAGRATNRFGLGARVRVTAAGLAPQMREIHGGIVYLGQNEPLAHFGLGAGRPATVEVTITWPKTNQVQVLHDVRTNTEITIEEP
jgi:hypothetical protein